jgi:hypothetical protein
MNGRNDHSRIGIVRYVVIRCALMMLLSACGASNSGNQGSQTSRGNTPSVPTLALTATPLPSASETPVPTSVPLSTPVAGLHGPTNFLLSNTLNFSSASGQGIVNGATLQLSQQVIEQGVTTEMQRTLFVVNSSNNILVYPNGASSPLQAQVSQNADGSTSIRYTHSSQSGTSTFNGTLTGNQMNATYSWEFLSGTTVGGQTFSGGNNATSTFATPVRWVASNEIPSPPTSARYQLTSDGGVALTWIPGNSGGTVKYNIYRFVLTDSRGFLLIASTSGTSYTDESTVAKSNAQTITGLAYAIYAVGTTGVENPTDSEVAVSSLG